MATGRVPTTANSPLTAKGDLFGYSTTQARVAVGNDGETLVADSSTSTGLRYNPSQAAGKNVLINGAFDIWQRGTSFTSGALASPYFVADRWQATRGGAASGATISRQTSGAPTGFQYYVRLQRDSGNTGTQGINLGQCIETSMAQPYASQTITLSFYARAGATYNSAASNVNVYIYTGTGTDQNNFSGTYTGVATALNSTASVTTSWQRFSYTVTLASTVTEFEPLIITQHSGTAGATDYVDVTGVQIEIGSVATGFTRAAGTIQGELAACQRYYYRITPVTSLGRLGIGNVTSSTGAEIGFTFPVTMRTSPTALEQSGTASDYSVRSGSTNTTCSAVPAFNVAEPSQAFVNFTVASGLTTGQAAIYRNPNTAGYLGWSAEL